MSNAIPDVDYGDFSTAVMFALRQWTLGLNVAAPGEIVEVDATKRRAKVRSAFAPVGADGSALPRPEIADVPIVWPRGTGYTIVSEVKAGDSVLLVFAQRGMEAWKEAHEPGAPPPDGLMSMKDAVCLPGFGPSDPLTLASTSGISIQKDDGTQNVVVRDDLIQVKAAAGAVVVEAEAGKLTLKGNTMTIQSAGNIEMIAGGNLTIAATQVTHGGVNIGNTHVHAGVQTGAAVTLVPQ